MQQKTQHTSLFNAAIVVAALGYFVDIYDLLLVTIVKKQSLIDLGVNSDERLNDIEIAGLHVLNWQMLGMLIGGILWGMMGDKKGRLSVLFGSILLYSTANIITGYVHTVDQYAYARFAAGIGLAGELGAGITLVSELLPKKMRGIGTSLVAGFGLFGAVAAYFTYQYTQDWRLCYKIGGVLGICLLLLRITVAESGMFKQIKEKDIQKGNFLMFFTNRVRFRKYMLAILIGLPTWYVIGILVNSSDKFAYDFYGKNQVFSNRSMMYAYAAIAVGDILIGFISHWFKSRKKALYLFYFFAILSGIFFFSGLIKNDVTMYLACAMLGFSTGFWAIFVTMGAEQFGTNLRATAATTIPNMVRGSLLIIAFLYKNIFQVVVGMSRVNAAIWTGVVVMSLTLIAAYFIEETFHKDLDYLEVDETLP